MGRGLAFGILGVALLGACFATAQAPRSNLALVLLAVLGLGLEVGAVRLTWFGFFSGAFAAYFAMALLPGVGPGAAAAAALLGIGLRTLFRGLNSPHRWWREALADLVPAAGGLAGAALFSPPGLSEPSLRGAAVGLLAYLPLTLHVPPALAAEVATVNPAGWARLREMTGVQAVALGFMGPTVAMLAAVNPWNSLWLLPILLALHRAARTDLLRVETIDRQELERRELESRRQLARVSETLSATRRELQIKVEEQSLQQELASSLFRSRRLDDTVQATLEALARTVRCQSTAVFLAQEDRLVAVGCRSPHSERLRAGCAEPVVQQAWAERRIVVRHRAPDGESRVFHDEATCAGIPLEDVGVLYIGRPEPGGFSSEEGYLLTVLSGQAALGIQSARRFEAQQEGLSKLKLWVQRLSYLLEGSRALASSLSQQLLLDRLQELVRATMPGDAGAIVMGDAVARSWGRLNEAELVPVARRVMEAGGPLLVDDLAGRSLLAVPLWTEQETTGALLLLADQPGAFTREQQDILHLIAYQSSVALHNALLYQEVLETQAQLVQSAKMAAVGQLAAGVAHEINTPLGAVLLQIESAMLRLESKPQLALKKLEMAQSAALVAKEIISKLLFYSREGARGQRETSLNDVVRDTLELLGNQLTLDGVELVMELCDSATLVANQNELQQVLANLLLNARDAALSEQARSRRVTVRTEADPERVRLVVQDDGPGISPDVLKRVFEPFFTTKPVGKGTGLGLSVSQQIVTAHQGSLAVDSSPGRGARFVVELPRHT
ncbi:MAG: ATP-binding protein [Candidatus Eremiobacterota bacterium]